MISIIVSSYKTDLYASFTKSVEETIGCAYEIIKIDNPGVLSLSEVYNKGWIEAKYDILCFCHEDILFHTKNWGRTLLDIFHSNKIGVLGVAGTKEFGDLPIGWWNFNWNANVSNYIQSSSLERKEYLSKNFEENNLVKVHVVDGLFLATTKSNDLKFNYDFRGFHGYDISFCLESIRKGFNNYVTNEILIEHFSGGNLDENWIKTLVYFVDYYNKDLKKLSNFQKSIAYEALKEIIIKAYDFNLISISNKYWCKFILYRPLSKFNFWFLLYKLKIVKK